MKIVGLVCTNGRFTYLQRLLSFFLMQNYPEKHLLVFNNAREPIEMKPIKNIEVVNNFVDYQTQKPYSDLGSIYRDALTHIPSTIDLVSIMDDDDIYLPAHFSRAISDFMIRKEICVWKPGYVFLKKSDKDVTYVDSDINNFESSCVLRTQFLKECGFVTGTSLELHYNWISKAYESNSIYVDKENTNPTFCYEMGQNDLIHTSHYSISKSGATIAELEKEIKKYDNFGKGKLLVPLSKRNTQRMFKDYFGEMSKNLVSQKSGKE